MFSSRPKILYCNSTTVKKIRNIFAPLLSLHCSRFVAEGVLFYIIYRKYRKRRKAKFYCNITDLDKLSKPETHLQIGSFRVL
jgi:hypothetical protein